MRNIQVLSPVTGKVYTVAGTPDLIARACLAEAHNDPDRAVRLAGKRARGANLRAVIREIGNALLRGRSA